MLLYKLLLIYILGLTYPNVVNGEVVVFLSSPDPLSDIRGGEFRISVRATRTLTYPSREGPG